MKEKNQIVLGCLCALGCELLFGLSYVFTKQATMQAGALELLGWRFVIAFIIMTVCRLTGMIKVNIKRRNPAPLLIIALFHPVIYFIGETLGISLTSASESGVFLACIPVASLVMSTLFLKKRPSRRQIIGILVTLAGVLVTVFAAGASVSLSVTGYLFLTMAVMSYAMYSVLVEKTEEFTETEITYGMLAAGACLFGFSAVISAVIHGTISELICLPVKNKSFLMAVLYQGIGCSIVAFFLSNTAIAKIGVNRTSSFIGASTVVSILGGVLVLHESFSGMQMLGAVIIIAGIYMANMKKG